MVSNQKKKEENSHPRMIYEINSCNHVPTFPAFYFFFHFILSPVIIENFLYILYFHLRMCFSCGNLILYKHVLRESLQLFREIGQTIFFSLVRKILILFIPYGKIKSHFSSFRYVYLLYVIVISLLSGFQNEKLLR